MLDFFVGTAQAQAAAPAAAGQQGSTMFTMMMFGKIAAVEESAFLIEVSKGMKIRFLKDKVARTYVVGSEEPSGS